MKPDPNRKSTVKKIIDGQPGLTPSVPAVWGISATIDNFTAAMGRLGKRQQLEPVEVDLDMIRASGLVKDKIGVEQPDEDGKFSTTLLREAVKDTLDYEMRWANYAQATDSKPVLPVLVVQAPDKASVAKLTEIVTTIEDEWKGLGSAAIVHVFGERDPIVVGNGRVLHYVPPETIQGDSRIRVVIAKEAISTGWDCPRAEVLYSERKAKDATHIAQIIGRMVRQPLAQRIETDDALNTVKCYLPEFNRKTLAGIVAELEGGPDADRDDSGTAGGLGGGSTVGSRTRIFDRNPDVPAEVFEFVESLPSIPAPTVYASPLRRARKLAIALCAEQGGNAIEADAPQNLTEALNAELDGLAAKHKKKLAANIKDLETADIRRTDTGPFGDDHPDQPTDPVRQIATHISDLSRDVDKIIRSVKEGAGLDYYRHLVDEAPDGSDLLTIKTRVAALLDIDEVVESLEEAATKWVHATLANHAVAIKHTSGSIRAEFRRIEEMTADPEAVTIDLNDNYSAATLTSSGDRLPVFEKHLYCDDSKQFPGRFTSWERIVIEIEIGRDNTVAWYRNPSRATHAALRIAYQKDDNRWTSLQPDFVIVSKMADNTLTASIVDPHSSHLADGRNKLVALAAFAEQYGEAFVRIETINKVGDTLRMLDMTKPEVREAVRGFEGAEVAALYEDEAVAVDYQLPA